MTTGDEDGADVMAKEVESLITQQVMWAHTYSAYERLAGGQQGPRALARLLEPAWREFERTGRVPEWCGVDLLRGWAFYLAREDRFDGGYLLDAGGAKAREWEAVLEQIAAHPSARGADVPPLRAAPREDNVPSAPAAVGVLDTEELARARRQDLDIDRDAAHLGEEALVFTTEGSVTDTAVRTVHFGDAAESARASWRPGTMSVESLTRGDVKAMDQLQSSEVRRLLRGVLDQADSRGVRFAKKSTVDRATFERFAALVHHYAWEHGTDESDVPGWRRYPGGLLAWWAEAADLTDEEKHRLHKFRSDIVHHLQNEKLARRDNPQSNHLHVNKP